MLRNHLAVGGVALAGLCGLVGCAPAPATHPSLTTQQPPQPILSEEEAKGLVSLPWTEISPDSSPQVAPSGHGFTVSVPVTGCVPHIRGVTATITATTVLVAVMGDSSPPATSCAPSGVKEAVIYVRLPDAAAGHVVEHAAVAAPSGPATTGR